MLIILTFETSDVKVLLEHSLADPPAIKYFILNITSLKKKNVNLVSKSEVN